MKSIIGKKYVARDNSYLVNLTCPSKDIRLAGTMGKDKNPLETEIVSEPYEFEIKSEVTSFFKTFWFVNVKYDKYVIRVLYDIRNVDADINERIRESKILKNEYTQWLGML